MKPARFIRDFIVILVMILFYGPLLYMVSRAFFEENNFSLTWFQQLFEDPSFWTALENSFIIALVSSLVSVVLALLAVLRIQKKKATFFDQVMLMSLSFPEIVLALSSLSLFVLVKWPLGVSTMIVAHTTLTLSFAYFILSAQMKKLDPSLVEAAQDLGATEAVVRNRILLPWLKSSIISSFFLCFLLSLDDFLISFFVSGVGQDTLPIKLFSMLKIGISPKINALSFLILAFSLLMMLGFFPFLKNLRRKYNE